MNTFKHSSLGYLSGLLIIGATGALVGCGGGGDAAKAAHGGDPATLDPGTAGETGASTGGSSATGSGGSSTAATGGSSASSGGSGGTSKGGSSGSSGSSDSSGSSGSSGKGGASGSAGSAGAGAGTSLSTPKEVPYARGTFAADVVPARCQANTAKDGKVTPAKDPSCITQPLLSAELTLSPRDEVSLLAPSTGGGFGTTLDDAENGYAELGVAPTGVFADVSIVDTTSGNLDDDGNVELIVAAFQKSDGALVIRVEDSHTDAGPQAQRDDRLFDSELEFEVSDSIDGIVSPFKQASVRVSDVDQDGRAEILVTALTKDGRVVARIYDDALAGFSLIAEPYVGKGTGIAAAFGNFDDDPAPELAVLVDTGMNVSEAGNLELNLLDDTDNGSLPLRAKLVGKETGLIRGTTLATRNLRLETGNFDSDRYDELVAFADGNDSGDEPVEAALFMAALDDAKAGFALLPNSQSELPLPRQNSTSSGYPNQSTPGWRTLVADTRLQRPNTSAKAADTLSPKLDEVFVVETVEPDDQSSGYDIKLFHRTLGSAAWADPSEILTLATNVDEPNFSLTAAAGNLDNLASDVLVAVRSGTTLTPIRVQGHSVPGNTTAQYGLKQIPLPTHQVDGANLPVFATGGDYDADAMRVRYTGKRTQKLLNPEPILVLSAPPVNADIAQDSAGSYAHYGASKSKSEDETTEYAVTDSLTFSTEISPPIIGDFFGLTASYSLSQTFSTSSTTTSMTTYTETADVKDQKEAVMFNGTLCEVYEYQIVGAGSSDAISGKISINEPIATKTFVWTVDDYNDALGGLASPIDSKVLTHTVGDPASYASDPQPSTNSWVSPATTVGGDLSIVKGEQIDVAHEQTNGATTTTSNSAGGGSTGLVGIQYTQSYDTTGSYSWTVGQNLSYAGFVGGIDPSDGNYSYSFGVWVHNVTLAHGEVVQVLDFYTDASKLSAYGSQ